MTTPIIILGLLTIPYLGFQIWSRATGQSLQSNLGAVVGLSIAFLFFGIGHFAQTDPMAEMLPPWVPLRVQLIYLTGVIEWALAAALLMPRWRRLAAWVCIAVLVAFFPANIYAAVNSTGMGGHQWGPVYLLIRGPLQAILIAWTYWFVARSPES